MNKQSFLIFFAAVTLCAGCAGRNLHEVKEIPYPETRYQEWEKERLRRTRAGMESLLLKTQEEAEGGLRETEKTFFEKGTGDDEMKDYLKEAEEERIEELSPILYEFGPSLRKGLKTLFDDWLLFKREREGNEEDRDNR